MTFSRPYSPQLVVLRFKSIPVPLTVPHFGTGGRGRGGGSGTNSSPASWITEQATGPRSQKSNPVKGPQAPVPAVWSSTVEEHARGGGYPVLPQAVPHFQGSTMRWGPEALSRLPAVMFSDSGSPRKGLAVASPRNRKLVRVFHQRVSRGPACDLARIAHPGEETTPEQGMQVPKVPEAQDTPGELLSPSSSLISASLRCAV